MRKTGYLLLLLLAAGGASAAIAERAGISVEHAWARPTIGAATGSAAYFTITDNGAPDRLVGVSTPAAASADIHESIDDHGVMKMRPVTGVALEPGKPVSFSPGGYHVMLMGVKPALKAGDSFPMTLRFEHAPAMTVTVAVQAGPRAMQGHGMHMGHDMPMGTGSTQGAGKTQ